MVRKFISHKCARSHDYFAPRLHGPAQKVSCWLLRAAPEIGAGLGRARPAPIVSHERAHYLRPAASRSGAPTWRGPGEILLRLVAATGLF